MNRKLNNLSKTEEETKQNYDKLRRIHASTNKSVTEQEKKIKQLNVTINILLEEKSQWMKSKEQWTQIMQQTLNSSNASMARISDEIQNLREENRKLREETANLKGE